MTRVRFTKVVLLGLLLLLLSGCSMSSLTLRTELESVINAYGQGLINKNVSAAMSQISLDYYDSNGVDYWGRHNQVLAVLVAGDYLGYTAVLATADTNANRAVGRGVLTTVYRTGGVTFTKRENKEWMFTRENGRWRIQSERAM